MTTSLDGGRYRLAYRRAKPTMRRRNRAPHRGSRRGSAFTQIASLLALSLYAGHCDDAVAQTADPIKEEQRNEGVALGEQAANEPPAEPTQLLTFSGEIGVTRFYYRNYFHSSQESRDIALGGNVIVHTAQLAGFSAGAGLYFGQTLGLYDRRSPGYNTELASADGNRTTLRQGYLQFQSERLLVRAGRQLIQTPFATQDYFTFHPRAFNGFAARYDVIGKSGPATDVSAMSLDTSTAKLSVMVTRMYDYAGRFADGFTKGSEVSAGHETRGFWAAGVRYNGQIGPSKLVAQAWYYDYIDYARLAYGHVAWRSPAGQDREFIAAFQAVRQWNSSGNGRELAIITNGNATSVDAQIYGASIGARSGGTTFSLIGNYAPRKRGAFRNGALLQPYTMIPYTLLTDTLQTGVAEGGPGYAYGANVTFKALQGRFSSSISAVRYKARYGFGKDYYTYKGPLGFGGTEAIPNQKSWAVDAINNLDLSKTLKGLSASYVLGIAHTENRPGYPHYDNPFVISRFYIKWAF